MKAPIKGIRTYHLVLDTGYHLDIFETHFVPLIARNLISISKLDVPRFIVKFESSSFSLYKNYVLLVLGFSLIVCID